MARRHWMSCSWPLIEMLSGRHMPGRMDGVKPVPKKEGSDLLLNTIFKCLHQKKKKLCFLPASNIAPLFENRKLSVHRPEQLVAGLRLYDEFTADPDNEEALFEMWEIFVTSLKMCIAGCWHLELVRCPFRHH